MLELGHRSNLRNLLHTRAHRPLYRSSFAVEYVFHGGIVSRTCRVYTVDSVWRVLSKVANVWCWRVTHDCRVCMCMCIICVCTCPICVCTCPLCMCISNMRARARVCLCVCVSNMCVCVRVSAFRKSAYSARTFLCMIACASFVRFDETEEQ